MDEHFLMLESTLATNYLQEIVKSFLVQFGNGLFEIHIITPCQLGRGFIHNSELPHLPDLQACWLKLLTKLPELKATLARTEKHCPCPAVTKLVIGIAWELTGGDGKQAIGEDRAAMLRLLQIQGGGRCRPETCMAEAINEHSLTTIFPVKQRENLQENLQEKT